MSRILVAIHNEQNAKLTKSGIFKGYIRARAGTRIFKTEGRFIIKRATVWNLSAKNNIQMYQVANFVTTFLNC